LAAITEVSTGIFGSTVALVAARSVTCFSVLWALLISSSWALEAMLYSSRP
jgi:hypothetical protein